MLGKTNSAAFDDGFRLRFSQERGELVFSNSSGKRPFRCLQTSMGQHFRQKRSLERFRLCHQLIPSTGISLAALDARHVGRCIWLHRILPLRRIFLTICFSGKQVVTICRNDPTSTAEVGTHDCFEHLWR